MGCPYLDEETRIGGCTNKLKTSDVLLFSYEYNDIIFNIFARE